MREVVGKRGASHFEMIISFVFFIGFVFFIFTVLKPYDTSTLSGTVVAGLYDSFEEMAKTNLSNVFLKVNYTVGSGCFYIQLPSEIFSYPMSNSHVTKLSGEEINSSLMGNKLKIVKGENFFRVAISPEFNNETIVGCSIPSDYELGQPVEREVISYSALVKMNESYFSDYEKLKRELKVPAIFDFAIIAESLPIKMEPQHGAPDLVDVIAHDYVVGVLRSDGSLTNEKFSLRIW